MYFLASRSSSLAAWALIVVPVHQSRGGLGPVWSLPSVATDARALCASHVHPTSLTGRPHTGRGARRRLLVSALTRQEPGSPALPPSSFLMTKKADRLPSRPLRSVRDLRSGPGTQAEAESHRVERRLCSRSRGAEDGLAPTARIRGPPLRLGGCGQHSASRFAAKPSGLQQGHRLLRERPPGATACPTEGTAAEKCLRSPPRAQAPVKWQWVQWEAAAVTGPPWEDSGDGERGTCRSTGPKNP